MNNDFIFLEGFMPILKDQVINYILKLIHANDKKILSKTLEAFNGDVSKSSVYNYLNELCKKNIIRKEGSSYFLVSTEYLFGYDNFNLGEDRIFSRDIEPLFKNFPKNVFSAWRYAFTEMMNNAIEHSNATQIVVTVRTNALETTVYISDNGIGIFKNIQEYVAKENNQDLSLEECASLLFAGKFTTAKSMHSGEGIFFTSHLMDRFIIFSDNIVFSRDNFSDSDPTYTKLEKGTLVIMSLNNQSKKTTREVFDRFSNVDDGFIKTQIPIAHIFSGAGPVSRSEARRLGELIVKFKEVDLDFSNVDEVGQAFVHELFIVWQNRNPNILLNVLNANDDVDFMIKRVKNTN